MSLKTFRDPKASIWQSVVDEALRRKHAAGTSTAAPAVVGTPARPTLDHPVVAAATGAASAALSGIGTTAAPPA
ncbi:MAG TPA: hypothetical protein VGG20_08585, partial [Thermoanaerobaculia bacterium]